MKENNNQGCQAKGKEHWNITRSNLDNEGEKTHVHHKKQKLLADVVGAEGVGGTGAINAAITIQQIEPGEDQIYLLKPQQKQQSKNLSIKSKVGFNATRIIGQCALNSAIHSFNLEAAGPTLDNDNDNSKLDASHHSYLKMLTSPARTHFSKVTAGGGVKDKGKTKEDHGAEADSSVNSSLRFDQPVFPMFYPHQVKSVSSGISFGMESQEKELYLSTAQSQLSLVSRSGTLSKSAGKPGTAVHEKKQTAWRKEPKQEWVKSPVVYKRRRMSKLEGQGKDDFIVQSDRANGSDVSDPQETSEAIGEKVMGDLGLSALK